MTNAVQQAWNAMARVLPDPLLARLSGGELVAPCFHLVTEGPAPPHVRHLFRCPDVPSFKLDLDRLLKGRTPVSLQDLEKSAMDGRPLPPNSVFISFDDGMREMADIVAPVCRAKGVPATFFLTTGFLDNRSLFYRHKASMLLDALETSPEASRRLNSQKLCEHFANLGMPLVEITDFLLRVRYQEAGLLDECARIIGVDFERYLRERKPYLTGEQVKGLLNQGFSIGAHSVDHPLFADLDLAEQIRQTRESLEHLASAFKIPVRTFAFPFVSTGVERSYYDCVFKMKLVDLLFCIGGMPEGYPRRIISRFGVENVRYASASEVWRAEAVRRMRRRLGAPARAQQAS